MKLYYYVSIGRGAESRNKSPIQECMFLNKLLNKENIHLSIDVVFDQL